MIIVVGKWKQKLIRLGMILIVIALFVSAVPLAAGILQDKVPVFSGWLDDENPSGNPLRVDNGGASVDFNQKIDQFVIKMQNFYFQESE